MVKLKIRRKPKTNKKIYKGYKILMAFILFQLIFAIITMPLFVFYGPFTNIRDMIVGRAMTSFKTQFVAQFFLSDEKIYKIIQGNLPEIPEADEVVGKLGKIDVSNATSDNIEVIDIDGGLLFKGKLMIVDNPRRIKVGYSSKMPKAGETTSAIAKSNSAVEAINAGGFVGDNFGGAGGKPQGFVISNGKVISGVDNYNEEIECIAFDAKGRMIVGQNSINQLKSYNVEEAVCFGPALVANGKPMIRGAGNAGIAPRTSIGQRQDGAILLLVVDGGRGVGAKFKGATYRDVQDILISYGAYNAANLDGGSSTTMYYKGKVINDPTNALGERTVPTIFYVDQAKSYVRIGGE